MSETTRPPRTTIRPSEPASAWTVYRILLRWTLLQVGGTVLPLVIVVQGLLAAGVIVGFGLLIPDIDTTTARFLATGTPAVLLLIAGLVMVPSGVAQARANGTFAYQRAMPIPRPLLLAAELTVWSMVAFPSVAVALIVARLRFGLPFAFDWPLLTAAILLITITAASVGFALAVSLPPTLAQLISQVLVFFVLLFSPVTFPASRLPVWFQAVHDWLPVRPAADLLRAGLASDVYPSSTRDLAVLMAWCCLGIALSLHALTRRR
jgi:ABC-2 type transport system permease protein